MVTPIEKLRDILEKGEAQARRNGNVLDGMYISAELARDIISAWPKLCEDAISRQQAIDTAIDAVDNWDGGCNKYREQIIRGALEILPSAQPEPESISEWKKEFREYVGSLDIARDDWKGIIEYIDELPSIQPEIIRCKDCKHSRFFDPCFYCYEIGGEVIVPENGFCFKAERREDG